MARRWLTVVVLLLALGGCGDEPEAEPATVPVPATSSGTPAPPRPSTVTALRGTAARAGAEPAPTSAKAAAEKDRSGTAGFVAVVRRELPGMAVDHRDEEIVALAEQACAALAAGRPAGAVVAGVRTFGIDRAGARELVRLAVEAVCPAQERRIDEF